jgi:hypothetical protein
LLLTIRNRVEVLQPLDFTRCFVEGLKVGIVMEKFDEMKRLIFAE